MRIEAFEKSCVRVYGKVYFDGTGSQWGSSTPEAWTTHQALLFNIEPVSRKVTVKEIVERLRLEHAAQQLFHGQESECKKLIERIERDGVEG